MAGTVVIAIDASPQAEAAFNWYLEHIHREGNAIVILHCIDLSSVSLCEQEESSSQSFAQLWDIQGTKIKELEGKYRWKLNEQGIPGKIRTLSGKPGELIVEMAKTEKAGLIVIGTRGLSKLKRTLAGSVSDHVLHHALCPVVICRQAE